MSAFNLEKTAESNYLRIMAGVDRKNVWAVQIEWLQTAHALSVRALAKELGVSDVFLRAVKLGVQPASPKLKYRLLKMSGHPMSREDLLLLLPDDLADEIEKDGFASAEQPAAPNKPEFTTKKGKKS